MQRIADMIWACERMRLAGRKPGDETMTADRISQNDVETAAAWYVVHSTDAEIQQELNLAFRTQCGYMIHILMHAKAVRASYR